MAIKTPLRKGNSNGDMEKPELIHSAEYSNAHNPSLVNAKRPTNLLSNSAKRIYPFEIKRVRRITSFSGNELATVPIAVVCIALLVWETLTVQRYEKYSD